MLYEPGQSCAESTKKRYDVVTSPSPGTALPEVRRAQTYASWPTGHGPGVERIPSETLRGKVPLAAPGASWASAPAATITAPAAQTSLVVMLRTILAASNQALITVLVSARGAGLRDPRA